MALQDILNDLVANNAKTDGSFYSVEQLKAMIANASIDVPGARPGATTITYSGTLGGVDAWKVAETIGADSNGQIRTIGQTEASQLLGSQEFKDALNKATGNDPVLFKDLYEGSTTNGIRNPDGLGDSISQRFIAAADGPIESITPNASANRIWAQTELDAALNNTKVPTINGIPREDLVRLRNDVLNSASTITPDHIAYTNRVVLDQVNITSVERSRALALAVDATGKNLLGIGTTDYFNKIGLAGMGVDLPAGMTGTPLSMPQTRESIANTQLANQHFQQYTQERITLAEAAGDTARMAEAGRYLNKLGVIGDVLALGLIANDANAAYMNGDTVGAQQIIKNGLLDYAGGLAGGIAAAEVVGAALAPLYMTGPAGAIIAGATTLVAGIAGGIGGEAAVRQINNLFTSSSGSTASDMMTNTQYHPDGTTTDSTAYLNGNTSVINRDAQGNVISVDVRTANSDGSFNTATSNANGTISNSVYDANNQLVSSTTKDTTTNSGTTQTYTNGVLTSKIDFGASSATTTDYNTNGTVSGVTTINSDNTASSERYNSNGATIYKAVTDATGAVTTSFTNNDGSISTRYPDGAVTTQSNSGNNYTLSTLYPDNSTEVIGYASGVVSYDAISYANGGDSNTNYQNGIVTSATLTHPDGSGSITHYNLDGSGDTYSYQADKSSSAVSFNKDGSLNRTENISATGTQDITIYGANNVITSTAKSFDDGSGLVKTYYADGTLKQQWFTQKDGSGSVVNNSADGKSGTTVVHNADGSGSTSGFNADGTSYARVNNADKSFNETTYFANGQLASLKITLADGSGSYKTYTNSGVLTSQLMRNADGSYSSDNYYFFADGTLASETHAKSDGSSLSAWFGDAANDAAFVVRSVR